MLLDLPSNILPKLNHQNVVCIYDFINALRAFHRSEFILPNNTNRRGYRAVKFFFKSMLVSLGVSLCGIVDR